MPNFLSSFDFFNRKRLKKARRDEDDKALFIQRYRAFREILRNNNKVLITMADMQEKVSGVFVFDRAYTTSSYRAIADGIKGIIDNLNVLADNKYKDLIIPFEKIDKTIRNRLEGKVSIPETDYIIPLDRLGREDVPSAGGKMAHLGELANSLRFPVPSGFVVTTYAYQAFVRHNRIQDLLNEKIVKLDIRDYDDLTAASGEMQAIVKGAEIPEDLERAILGAYGAMCRDAGTKDLKVGVRSSALHEDIMASFAGQYETALNAPADELLGHYRNVLSSQFTPRALYYYKDRGFDINEMAMAVGVIAMVQARASGIIYTRDPGKPQEDNAMRISAVWGLGSYAVGGIVPTQEYWISVEKGAKIISQEMGLQEEMLVCRPEGGTHPVPVAKGLMGKPCLGDEQVSELVAFARKSEDHFGQPQDMEWTIDEDDRLYLLQSRPLRLPSHQTSTNESRPRVAKGHKILLDKGNIACSGVGAGPVYVVERVEDLGGFPAGGVLVVQRAHPEFALVLKKAAAVISDIGSVLGHLAKVAGEYSVPAIFNTDRATEILRNGMQVTVDAVYANVYEGVVDELLKWKGPRDISKSSPSLRQLKEILQMIAPLNLTDPGSPHFGPGGCKTLHDITRFAHEVSLKAMFDFSKESHFSERSTRRLVCEVPMQWWVIDLEDGLKDDIKDKRVRPEDIVSIPMQALWEGMTAFPWRGPPPVDTKGFLSVMFSATTDPSIDPAVGKRFVDKNYIVISKHFCNVSSRMGFHFSTTEAYVGDNPNENYTSFIFKGGGADTGRKIRRIRCVGRLLDRFGFRTEFKEDAISARLEGHDRDYMLEHLKVLGYILIQTRQLDMAMYNDAMVEWYYNDMLKQIKSFVKIG